MEMLMVQLLNGLAFGLIFALIAAGLTLIWGIMDFINVAHAELYMVGGYTAWLMITMGAGFWPALIVGPLVAGLLALLLRLTVLKPIFGRHPLHSLLATFGISVFLQDLALYLFGPFNREIRIPLAGTIDFGFVAYPIYRVLVMFLAMALLIGLWLFITRSTYGNWIRAVALDREMASALGVPVPLVQTIVFVLGSAMAGLAGVIAAPLFSVYPTMGESIILYAFMIVMVGGLGNYLGSVVAGILVGVLIALGSLWLPPTMSFVGAFLLLLVILLIRPQGILQGVR